MTTTYSLFLLITFILLSNGCSIQRSNERIDRQLEKSFIQTDNCLVFNRLITNRDYIIYLYWLNHTYGASYFDRVFFALPEYKQINKQQARTGLYKYRNLSGLIPFVTQLTRNYIFNPKYYHYPVTGLDEQQIFEFGKWMMDRYNENSLIQRGIYRYNAEQLDEDNFITESYLADQYMGSLLKHPIKDWSERIFLPLFRPPIEEEIKVASYLTQINQSFKPFKHDFLAIWEKGYFIEVKNSALRLGSDFIIAPSKDYIPSIEGVYIGESAGYYNSYELDLTTIIKSEEYPFEEKDHYGRMPFTIIGSTRNNTPLVIDNQDLFEEINPKIGDTYQAILLIVNN